MPTMPQKPENKEQPPKIYIAMACYDSVKINTMLSVARLVKELPKANLEWQIETYKSPYVSNARKALTALFLRSKYDYLLFIDADVEFQKRMATCEIFLRKSSGGTNKINFRHQISLPEWSAEPTRASKTRFGYRTRVPKCFKCTRRRSGSTVGGDPGTSWGTSGTMKSQVFC